LTHTTLPTIQAVDVVQRAHRLLSLGPTKMSLEAVRDLTQLTDAVLSFTAFYLRQTDAPCRPEQRYAFDALKALVIQLEKQHGNKKLAA
jgi:hypothetical protein